MKFTRVAPCVRQTTFVCVSVCAADCVRNYSIDDESMMYLQQIYKNRTSCTSRGAPFIAVSIFHMPLEIRKGLLIFVNFCYCRYTIHTPYRSYTVPYTRIRMARIICVRCQMERRGMSSPVCVCILFVFCSHIK